MFLDNQVFNAFHDEIGTLGYQFREHVLRSRSSTQVLTLTRSKFAACPRRKSSSTAEENIKTTILLPPAFKVL